MLQGRVPDQGVYMGKTIRVDGLFKKKGRHKLGKVGRGGIDSERSHGNKVRRTMIKTHCTEFSKN